VKDVLNKITFSEYKRRQAAPGLKVSPAPSAWAAACPSRRDIEGNHVSHIHSRRYLRPSVVGFFAKDASTEGHLQHRGA
jgi:hypothetical protein